MLSTQIEERNGSGDAVVMDHDAENDRKARHLLQKLGFDPDHIYQDYVMDCSPIPDIESIAGTSLPLVISFCEEIYRCVGI